MEDICEKLKYEIASELDAMDKHPVGSEEKKRGAENVEKLYKLLILAKEKEQKSEELELREREVAAREKEVLVHQEDTSLRRVAEEYFRKEELKLKEQELKQKNSLFDKVLKGLEIALQGAAIVLPVAAYDRIAQSTFEFERGEIITSSFGKSLSRVLSPKSWFRK